MFTVVPLLLATLLLTRLLRPRHRVEFLLVWFIVLPACIFFLALLASSMDRLADVWWWTGASFLLLLAVALPVVVNPPLRARCFACPAGIRDLLQRLRRTTSRQGDLELLWLGGLTLTVTAVINFIVLAALAPATPDALSYHLARMAYYLQQGNLNFFDANYWAQVAHPKVATTQMIYLYLATGRNENLTQLAQYFAYGVCLIAVYGISRQLGAGRRGSLFAALVFGLLPIMLTGAACPQNDLVLTAFVGGTVYFLLAYRESPRVKYLLFAAAAFALALGVKATALLVIPSLLVVAVLLFLRREKRPAITGSASHRRRARSPKTSLPASSGLRDLAVAGVGLILTLAIIALPAGYWDNIRHFGDPLGPKYVSEVHAGTDAPLRDGMLNMARYGLEFLALDGLPPFEAVEKAQTALYWLPRHLFQVLHINLESKEGARAQFKYSGTTLASDSAVYWGILGFALVWPVVWISLFGKKRSWDVRLFALAAVVFFVVQSFAGLFDLWRGRYFITDGLFALPPLAVLFLPGARWARVYLQVVLALGCLTALAASVFRYNTYLFSFTTHENGRTITFDSAFAQPPFRPVPTKGWPDQRTMDHLTARDYQLTRLLPDAADRVLYFDALVPPHATVAMDIGNYGMDYLFFGEHLTRRLISIRTYDRKGQPHWEPIPRNADYLLLDAESIYRQPNDIPLFLIDNPAGRKYLFMRDLSRGRQKGGEVKKSLTNQAISCQGIAFMGD